jgi:RNA polymerase sigma-70 factor (ECF subfamily)
MSTALVELALTERTVWVTDEEELAQFVAAEYRGLVAALSLVCGDRSTAEDAVQEALARAVIAQRRGRIDSLPAWVRVVALNQLRNRWRSKSREKKATQLLRDTQVPSGADDEIERSMDLTTALATLSPRQREAVALHYRLGLSVAETARAMQVTDGTVKTLLSRARAGLGVALSDGEDHCRAPQTRTFLRWPAVPSVARPRDPEMGSGPVARAPARRLTCRVAPA